MLRKISILSLVFSGLIMTVLNGKNLTSEDLSKEAIKKVKVITTSELVQLLKKKPNTPIIDVRSRADILKEGGYIKANKVTLLPRDKMEFLISDVVDYNDTFVVHCNTGNISLLASEQLKRMGYKNLLYYKESFQGWKKANLPTSSLDRYPESMLYSKIQKVAQGIYVSLGQTSPSTYENSGHNNNLGFIVGNDSVLVWNAGGNYLLAKALHVEIKKITNKPVKYVLLENSQSHAMLGSSYWKEQGATIVSQEIAKQEIMSMGDKILDRKRKTLRDKLLGTKIVLPDITFKDKKVFDLGGRIVEAKYFGYAHEHSDISLWLPKEKILFGGDLAFNGRVLPIFKHTDTRKWLEAEKKVNALNPKIVIPGHGDVTDMATVNRYTRDYVKYLRDQITKILEDDGDLNDAYRMDLSAYEHLDTFKELAKQNIAILYGQMEFEE